MAATRRVSFTNCSLDSGAWSSGNRRIPSNHFFSCEPGRIVQSQVRAMRVARLVQLATIIEFAYFCTGSRKAVFSLWS